jgi:hypothetical protein
MTQCVTLLSHFAPLDILTLVIAHAESLQLNTLAPQLQRLERRYKPLLTHQGHICDCTEIIYQQQGNVSLRKTSSQGQGCQIWW